MTKYNTNLIEHCEKMDNRWKWIAIAALSVFILAIIGLSVKNSRKNDRELLDNTKQQKEIVASKNEQIEKSTEVLTETKKEELKEIPKKVVKKSNPKKKVTKNIPKKKTSTKKKSINKEFVNQINGYKISGVAVARGIAPQVYLRKGDQTISLNVGDEIGEFKVTAIHRTYVLLKKGNKNYHLNFLN